MMDLGEWKRPYAYTSPAEEHRAVRERVGMIDVRTLGKLEVKGKDAAQLLDKVYTHSFSSLRVGRVRYGIMCDDSGIILDDGTVSRFADDHFFLTTTTGNIDFVEQWLKSWTVGPMCAYHQCHSWFSGHERGRSAGTGSVRQTDRPRSLLRRLFLTWHVFRARWSGVPALLLRIGFVGETGWEIHVPADYGEHVWDALMEAGKEFGIAPFGVEAQRILRLEKKHLIVGQDTDALSNPLEADMAWVVKFDKADLSVRERWVRTTARSPPEVGGICHA